MQKVIESNHIRLMDMVNLIAVNCGNVAMGWVDSQALEVGAGGFYYCNYSSA